jgi:hypothetical protein
VIPNTSCSGLRPGFYAKERRIKGENTMTKKEKQQLSDLIVDLRKFQWTAERATIIDRRIMTFEDHMSQSDWQGRATAYQHTCDRLSEFYDLYA